MLTIYILSGLICLILFIWDEIKCYDQLTLTGLLQVLTVSIVPILNTLFILWYLFEELGDDFVIYKRKGK